MDKEKRRKSKRLADMQQTFGIVYDVRNTGSVTRLSMQSTSSDYVWEAQNREISLHQFEFDGEGVRLALQASAKHAERSNMVEVKLTYVGLKALILEMERVQLNEVLDEKCKSLLERET